MDGFLQVNSPSLNLASSPSNSFLADEVASICPLITPSPPTNDLINPLPETTQSNFVIGKQLASILQHVQDDDKCNGDSASSSSSTAEPACTQLLNHRNAAYHHITKDEHTATEETAGKVQPLQLTFRNPPENYFFMSWNWPIIRRVSLGLFLAGLGAMVALVIAMIWTLPKKCDPYTEWYQGGVFYEVFPASFCDSNSDMVGDLRGIYQDQCLNYTKSLGVKAVRLNSIFKTKHYPEDYKNVTNLTDIATQLGDINDFRKLAQKLHKQDIKLVLDIPLHPLLKHLKPIKQIQTSNGSHLEPVVEFLKAEPKRQDLVEEALAFWIDNGADGFYLKGLEHFADDPHLGSSIRRWKKILGSERPLIVSEAVINTAPQDLLDTILNNVDLVDVRLEIEKGISAVTAQIAAIQNGTLFARRGLPWVHWNLGDESSKRLANVLSYSNATLGATLLQLMLPGTPSIFYGNEIGLQQISNDDSEVEDLKHLHQFAFMVFKESSRKVLPWMPAHAKAINFQEASAVAEMIELRRTSPAVYINSLYKEGENKANADVKYSRSDLLVIQRWYPRRKSHVVVSNLGNVTVNADLSTLLYSGVVKIGPRTDSKSDSISFKDIALCPGESVVIQLD